MTDFRQSGTHFRDASLTRTDIIEDHSQAAGAGTQRLATEETIGHKSNRSEDFGSAGFPPPTQFHRLKRPQCRSLHFGGFLRDILTTDGIFYNLESDSAVCEKLRVPA